MKINSIKTIKEYHIDAIEPELAEYCAKNNINDALVHGFPKVLRTNNQIAMNQLYHHIAKDLGIENVKQGFFNGIQIILKVEEIENQHKNLKESLSEKAGKLMTVKECALFFNTSEKTIRRRIESGALKVIDISDDCSKKRSIRIYVNDLHTLLK